MWLRPRRRLAASDHTPIVYGHRQRSPATSHTRSGISTALTPSPGRCTEHRSRRTTRVRSQPHTPNVFVRGSIFEEQTDTYTAQIAQRVEEEGFGKRKLFNTSAVFLRREDWYATTHPLFPAPAQLPAGDCCAVCWKQWRGPRSILPPVQPQIEPLEMVGTLLEAMEGGLVHFATSTGAI